AALLAEEKILAYQFHGTRYDCGSKLGYLQATLAYALRHPQVGDDYADLLRSRIASDREE
ncbi:MAG: UTP--glucose-1-phosphate uridylyltransferase GalU, partial [Burkholderiales bacterium]